MTILSRLIASVTILKTPNCSEEPKKIGSPNWMTAPVSINHNLAPVMTKKPRQVLRAVSSVGAVAGSTESIDSGVFLRCVIEFQLAWGSIRYGGRFYRI